jgi:hypothetical protein
MTKVLTPAQQARRLAILGDAMDKVDQELYAAERAGDVTTQIAALLERAVCWESYADLCRELGTGELLGAQLSARRDRTTALNLQAQAEQR